MGVGRNRDWEQERKEEEGRTGVRTERKAGAGKMVWVPFETF